MLGRLARYLRFVGCDTAYARGSSDDELLDWAKREDRVLLTRDRDLSQRSRSGFLIASPVLGEQWRAVRAKWPEVPTAISFARCTLCNGVLSPAATAAVPRTDPGLPPAVRDGVSPLYVCGACGHRYWEGSHTATVRRQIEAWERGERP